MALARGSDLARDRPGRRDRAPRGIRAAQLEAGRADVSFSANFNLRATVPVGGVTVRDIAGLCLHGNTLCGIEATGVQVRSALEHSARCFRPHEEGK